MNPPEVLFSAILTNYNHGHYLQERLTSILSQIPANAELVFVDDGSTDDSVAIAENFAKSNSRLRIYCNGRNLGIIPSLNIGLHKARGTYVACMAADDIALPGFIEKTLNLLQKYPEIPICCSDCGLKFEGFGDKDPDHIYSTVLLATKAPFEVFSAEEVISIFRTTSFWIPGHSSIVKKEAMLELGGFDQRLGPMTDWFVWHAIALTHGIVYIPETLSVWRQHGNNFSKEFSQVKDFKKRDAIFLTFLNLLSEAKNKGLRKLFKRSKIVNLYAKICFWSLLVRPKHYDLVMIILLQVFRNRFRRYSRNFLSLFRRNQNPT